MKIFLHIDAQSSACKDWKISGTGKMEKHGAILKIRHKLKHTRKEQQDSLIILGWSTITYTGGCSCISSVISVQCYWITFSHCGMWLVILWCKLFLCTAFSPNPTSSVFLKMWKQIKILNIFYTSFRAWILLTVIEAFPADNLSVMNVRELCMK